MAKLLSTFLLQMLFVLSAFFTPCLLHITSSDFISVHPGENITLLCTITDYPEISWYQLRSDEVKLLISAEQGKLEKTFSLIYIVNKSHFVVTESSSSVSLVIIGVGETDLGFYYCGGRNDDKHIQFGKPIRLNFSDKHHYETAVSEPPDIQQFTAPAFYGIIIIILSCVCAVSVFLNIICSSLHCFRLQDKFSSSGNSNNKEAELLPSEFTCVTYRSVS
ncbi:uncharacterized protein LOC124392797 isoform X2 [Silurus meridionalis]|uniref:uncharacterized protein LOC124392797 isoform X2 n=1 Tax=Silurus meridionalis TaxID=175797 RepID=UPI001EEA421C|nr:uncharacterized protein LOC124392797 isoform X2 [Silurus meridionalis]